MHLFHPYVLGSSGSSLVLWLNNRSIPKCLFFSLSKKQLGKILTYVTAPAKLVGNHKIFCLFLTTLSTLAGGLVGKEFLLLKPRENTHQMHCIFMESANKIIFKNGQNEQTDFPKKKCALDTSA